MPPQGISAQGTVIARSIDPLWPDQNPQGGSLDFIDIAELRDITPPALTRNEIEMTTHNEQDDAYIVGIRRHGNLEFNINWTPWDPSHDAVDGLQQAYKDGTRDIYRITYPDGSQWIFSGFLTNFEPDAPVDDRLSADVTIRPTGTHQWVDAP